MNKDTFLQVIIGILVTIAISLSGFSLKWTFNSNAELKILQEQIKDMREDHRREVEQERRDQQQDAQLHSFWKYCSWLHWQVNQLRHHDGLEPAENPNLDLK